MKQIVERLGHFPKAAEIPLDKEYLKAWIRSQKIKYQSGTLEPEAAQMLTDLGCDMTINSFVGWENRYEQLKRFLSENGRFPANADTKKSKELKELCTWVNTQRRYFIKGVLPDEQKALLDEIAFPWNVREEEWSRRFELLKSYFAEHGKLPEKNEIIDGVRLLTWYRAQSRAYEKGDLSETRIKQFETAGIPLDIKKNEARKSETWNRNLLSYMEFIQSHGRKPKFNDRDNGYMLYKWSYTQIEK